MRVRSLEALQARRLSRERIACRLRAGTCERSSRCAKHSCGRARVTSSLAKALVRRDGLRVAGSEAHLVAKRIAALELSDTLASELMPLFQVLAPINEQIDAADRRIAAAVEERSRSRSAHDCAIDRTDDGERGGRDR